LVFLTQSATLVNKFIQDLCNQYIEISGKKQVSQFMKNRYVLEYYERKGGPLLQKRFKAYDHDIFKLYRSYVEHSEDIFKQYFPAGLMTPVFLIGIILLLGVYTFTHSSHFLFHS
jgi:hypothetical protein